MLGRELFQAFKSRNIEFIASGSKVDITKMAVLNKFLGNSAGTADYDGDRAMPGTADYDGDRAAPRDGDRAMPGTADYDGDRAMPNRSACASGRGDTSGMRDRAAPRGDRAMPDGDRAAPKTLKWIINCAAYTDVERAEDEEELCASINARGPLNLAVIAACLGACLLHVSTDYVFDGTSQSPYKEDSKTNPLNAYGRTKAKGEELVRSALTEHVILRTSRLYGQFGSNFVQKMLELMKKQNKIEVVADQFGNPTRARDLAEAIIAIVCKDKPKYGTYHFANSGASSWYEFAAEIQALAMEKKILPQKCELIKTSYKTYKSRANRPAFSALSCKKIKEDYGLEIEPWKQALKKHIGHLEKLV